jgi:hypothetical protein
MHEAILRLCDDDELRQRLGRQARATIEQKGLTWTANAMVVTQLAEAAAREARLRQPGKMLNSSPHVNHDKGSGASCGPPEGAQLLRVLDAAASANVDYERPNFSISRKAGRPGAAACRCCWK